MQLLREIKSNRLTRERAPTQPSKTRMDKIKEFYIKDWNWGFVLCAWRETLFCHKTVIFFFFFWSYFFYSLPRNSTSAQASVLTHPLALAVNESLACVQPSPPLQQKGAQTTTTATKTSLKKRIRAASNFIALIPSLLIRQMLANFCGVEF